MGGGRVVNPAEGARTLRGVVSHAIADGVQGACDKLLLVTHPERYGVLPQAVTVRGVLSLFLAA